MRNLIFFSILFMGKIVWAYDPLYDSRHLDLEAVSKAATSFGIESFSVQRQDLNDLNQRFEKQKKLIAKNQSNLVSMKNYLNQINELKRDYDLLEFLLLSKSYTYDFFPLSWQAFTKNSESITEYLNHFWAKLVPHLNSQFSTNQQYYSNEYPIRNAKLMAQMENGASYSAKSSISYMFKSYRGKIERFSQADIFIDFLSLMTKSQIVFPDKFIDRLIEIDDPQKDIFVKKAMSFIKEDFVWGENITEKNLISIIERVFEAANSDIDFFEFNMKFPFYQLSSNYLSRYDLLQLYLHQIEILRNLKDSRFNEKYNLFKKIFEKYDFFNTQNDLNNQLRLLVEKYLLEKQSDSIFDVEKTLVFLGIVHKREQHLGMKKIIYEEVLNTPKKIDLDPMKINKLLSAKDRGDVFMIINGENLTCDKIFSKIASGY